MDLPYILKWYDTIDSTNLEMKRLLQEGCDVNTVIVAETQTEGKGRLGRVWDSSQGKGIWSSVLLESALPLEKMSCYSFAVAVAVAEGIRQSTGLEAEVKWPNDVLLKGKKVCGILLELVFEKKQPRIIAGFGINVNQELTDFSEEVRQKATSLAMETTRIVDRDVVLKAVLQQLKKNCVLLEKQGFEPIREAWIALSCVIGKEIQVIQNGESILYGTAVGLSENGALLIQTKNGVETVLAGDVSLRGKDGQYMI